MLIDEEAILMCDIRTYRRIEKAIESRMAFKEMFTAFDITLALQRQGVRKRHRAIRRDIRQIADVLMWRYQYDCTIVHFQEVGVSAFVYHPYATDASLHQPATRSRALARTSGRKQIAAGQSALSAEVV
ncbi:MAG TPA: hypothetical protein VKA60_10820 [Blastocatellia bacterium]|nr:hypothetical protein [Blastocatellia bacterium]